MTKAIGSRGLSLGDERTISVVDALGHSHHAVALLLIDALDISHELLHIEVSLRHIDEVGASAVGGSKTGSSSQPAGVTAHDLDDAHHTGIIDPGVMIDFHAGSGDILGSRGVTGAVVSTKEVIVDGLGHAHHTALIANLLHILADLVAGVHGVVTAIVEEVTDIILLEDLQDTLVVSVIHIGISHLIAAGTQGRGGGVQQQLQLLSILLRHIEKAVTQHTLDAVLCAIDLGDYIAVKSSADHTIGTGVDDGSGATGLADNAGAFENIHGKIPP